MDLYNIPNLDEQQRSHDVRDATNFTMYPIYHYLFSQMNVQYMQQVTGVSLSDVNDMLQTVYTDKIEYGHIDGPNVPNLQHYINELNNLAITRISADIIEKNEFVAITEHNRDAWSKYDLIPDRPSGVNYMSRRPPLDMESQQFIF